MPAAIISRQPPCVVPAALAKLLSHNNEPGPSEIEYRRLVPPVFDSKLRTRLNLGGGLPVVHSFSEVARERLFIQEDGDNNIIVEGGLASLLPSVKLSKQEKRAGITRAHRKLQRRLKTKNLWKCDPYLEYYLQHTIMFPLTHRLGQNTPM